MKRMNCEETMAAIIDAREKGEAVLSTEADLHLAGCAACQKEAAELRHLLAEMDNTVFKPAPAALGKGFYDMLSAEMLSADNPVKISRRYAYLSAAACIIFLAGIGFATLLINRNTNKVPAERVTVNNGGEKENLLLTHIQDPSSAMRIQAVNEVESLSQPDPKLVTVLIQVLNKDSNSNVRMAAVYALSKFADDTRVRNGLIGALEKETEPVIQVLLINLLADKKEERVTHALQTIIQNPATRRQVQEIAGNKLRAL